MYVLLDAKRAFWGMPQQASDKTSVHKHVCQVQIHRFFCTSTGFPFMSSCGSRRNRERSSDYVARCPGSDERNTIPTNPLNNTQEGKSHHSTSRGALKGIISFVKRWDSMATEASRSRVSMLALGSEDVPTSYPSCVTRLAKVSLQPYGSSVGSMAGYCGRKLDCGWHLLCNLHCATLSSFLCDNAHFLS
jgi:hypothetical protein